MPSDTLGAEIFFWTANKVFGPKIFNTELQDCMYRIYSRLLTTIVPLAVAYEMKTQSAAQNLRKEERAVSRRLQEEATTKVNTNDENKLA